MRLDQARDFWRSRGVPEEAIEDLWSMAEAARANDGLAEQQQSIEAVLDECGWHREAVVYLAQQRAMRMLMSSAPGGAEALREFARKFQPSIVAGMDNREIAAVAAVWTDGFCNAARAANLRGGK